MRKILIALCATITLQIGTSQLTSATTTSATISNILPSKNNPDPEKVKAALKDFKSLSHHEKKVRLKEVNKKIREFKKEKREGNNDSNVSTLLLVIIAILLPPLAVALHEGRINSRFWIDLLLTLLFYLPGLIYALVIILGKND